MSRRLTVARLATASILAALAATVVLAACGAGAPHVGSLPRHAAGTPLQSAGGSVHPPGWGATPPGYRESAVAPVLGVPTTVMFDTVTLETIPARPFALGGYTSGLFPTYLPLRRAFPHAHTISIAVTTAHHADCLDVEPGDAEPAQAGPWARADLAAGFSKPCLYSDLAEMPAVKQSLAAWLGPNWRQRVLLWLAWYRFRPGLVPGYDAVQWTDRALGRNLDQSTVAFPFLAIAQPPYQRPTPPKPSPSAKAARIALLRRLAKRTGCYVKHRRRKHACLVWEHQVRALER